MENEKLKEDLEKYMCGSKNSNGCLSTITTESNKLPLIGIIFKYGFHITKTKHHNCFHYITTDIPYSIMGEQKLPFF